MYQAVHKVSTDSAYCVNTVWIARSNRAAGEASTITTTTWNDDDNENDDDNYLIYTLILRARHLIHINANPMYI